MQYMCSVGTIGVVWSVYLFGSYSMYSVNTNRIANLFRICSQTGFYPYNYLLPALEEEKRCHQPVDTKNRKCYCFLSNLPT